MSKRRSDSARVLDFFQNQSLDVADAILGIVRETVKKRLADAGCPVTYGIVTKKRRPRRTKAEIAAASEAKEAI